MILTGWADDAWADDSWVPESWGVVVQAEAEQVIRNFRLRGRKKKDDRYEWLRQPRPIDEPVVEQRSEAIVQAVEAEALLDTAVDTQAELAARVRLEASKNLYLDTYEKVYRESMREDLISQWEAEVAQLKRRMMFNRRAAYLLLLAN